MQYIIMGMILNILMMHIAPTDSNMRLLECFIEFFSKNI